MKIFRIFCILALILAFIVVMFGAYTRLTHSGLGCPDWPGCYGKLIVPTQQHEKIKLPPQFSSLPLEATKAWTEMIHRYAAGTLAMLIIAINVTAWCYRRRGIPQNIPFFLLVLVGFQAALGMWTVTLKLLPVIVMGHLLGGLLIFGALFYLNLLLHYKISSVPATRWRIGLYGAIGIVFCQIALGGWVSSNYAGLACIGFPQCNGQWLPAMTWHTSFQLWSSIGLNYQGGLLDGASRVTIQMVHRIGATVVLIYLIGLGASLLWNCRATTVKLAVTGVIVCLFVQITLGVINVIDMLPLWAAVAHNGTAALLFAMVLYLHVTVGIQGKTHARNH